jgi:NADPH2:quinone reductase
MPHPRASYDEEVRAIQITELSGPATAVKIADVPEPEPSHPLTPGTGVVIDVHAAGVSFPEVLQSRGEYQIKPELPFVPGAEIAGIVRSAPDGATVKPGDRVAAVCLLGGFAETAVAPAFLTFPLSDMLSDTEGAGLIFNYHTAYFSLVTRGRLGSGETVLVHGAAGGIGTASLQIAKGLGARAIAVVSGDDKERVAREAGADEVVRSNGPWMDQVKELGGADVVLDPVGGDRFTDSLRSLREEGRAVVVGFTGGSIPEVRVNRLLVNNLEVIGAGWGAYVMSKPDVNRVIHAAVQDLVERGFVRPMVGARFPLERAGEALTTLDERRALGKIVLDVKAT